MPSSALIPFLGGSGSIHKPLEAKNMHPLYSQVTEQPIARLMRAYPKGPCTSIVYTWALNGFHVVAFGPRYILYRYMDPQG